MKHDLISLLFNDFVNADLSDIIDCKEVANGIADVMVEKLDERIDYWTRVMNDKRIQTSGYKIAKAKKEAYEEIKGMFVEEEEREKEETNNEHK